MCEQCEPYLIVKRGLYYRPNGEGYTGIRDNAGRYTYTEARKHIYDPGEGGNAVTIVPLSDAPEFTKECYDDLARDHLRQQRDILSAQVKLLRECHDEADSILRSAMAIAERDGRETNWPTFRAQLRFVLDTYFVARQAFASAERNEPK